IHFGLASLILEQPDSRHLFFLEIFHPESAGTEISPIWRTGARPNHVRYSIRRISREKWSRLNLNPFVRHYNRSVVFHTRRAASPPPWTNTISVFNVSLCHLDGAGSPPAART